jgi:hypothetical protein
MTFANRISDLISVGGTGNLTTSGTTPDATFNALSTLPGGVGASTGYVIKDGTSLEVGKLTIVSLGPCVFSRAVQQSTAGGTTPITCSVGATIIVCATAADFLSFVDLTSVQTMTNKRVTPRKSAPAFSATPTCNTDLVDILVLSGLTGAITNMSTNLTGTPIDGDTLEIHLKDDGTPRTIAYGTKIVDGPSISLPVITIASTRLRFYLQWDALLATPAWVCVGKG